MSCFATGGNAMYLNLICEELVCTGGKVIHIDKNVGNMEEVHKIVCDNLQKYPNGKWELYLKNDIIITV